MSLEIEIEEDSVQLLGKYCRVRPTNISAFIGRILREWYVRTPKLWKQKPHLIPNPKKIPESKVMKITINSDIAKIFNQYCFEFNLNPCDFASFLISIYWKAYMKKMVEIQKKRKMDKF